MGARFGVSGDPSTRGVTAGKAHLAALPLGRSVIVTIGIDRYAHWKPLECAANDARSTRDAFVARGFEEVVAPLYDEQATRDALNALVVDGLRRLSEHDQLVIFYAGHGGTRTEHPSGKKTQTGYLIPVDAAHDGDNVASWIELNGWLRSISLLPPRHILVILDSCSSGVALRAPYGTRGGLREVRGASSMLQARASRRVITSAIGDTQAIRRADALPLDRSDDAYTVRHDAWLWLALTNKLPDLPLNIALLCLDQTWNVKLVVPRPDDLRGTKYVTIADRPLVFDIRMTATVADAVDTFKLFIARDDVDFRQLATSALHTRDFRRGRARLARWAVHDFRVRTLAPG